MATTMRSGRYSSASIAMHWIMLLLLAAVYACIELRGYFPRGSAIREGLKAWHFSLGLAVFLLVWIRFALRMTQSPAPLVPAPAAWQRRLASAVHALLYVFMLGMPIAGWMILSAEGKSIAFFGIALPALVGADEALAGRVEELHETVGTIGYWLVGLHAAAALFHHFVLRDATLRRMWPRMRRPQ